MTCAGLETLRVGVVGLAENDGGRLEITGIREIPHYYGLLGNVYYAGCRWVVGGVLGFTGLILGMGKVFFLNLKKLMARLTVAA